jgi:signal transduction histidine kinase
MMYGERDDPATVLARLSQRLEAALAPAAALPTIVETVAQALRLPYVAITLETPEGEHRVAAETGQPGGELIRLPLTYQSTPVGELLLSPRSQGEALSTADLRLLSIVTQQAGVLAHNVRLADALRQLNADLQASRERLVLAQEEERRRLRRDLHDSVGPTLASLLQRLDTAADLVTEEPQASVAMLTELKGQVKGTLAEIRQLVYALRPPVLDEFGLVTALREHVAPYNSPAGLRVAVNAPEPMPPLPAAVEVAAYRIALEAFTNTVRHANAQACAISLKLEHGSLVVEVSDDGGGLPAGVRWGVGLTAMRERAAELGGECLITAEPGGGARVRARLPLPGLAPAPGSG